MIHYLDSTVLVASLMPDDPYHSACDFLLNQPGNHISTHSLNETFATLSGGKLGMRINTDVVARMIRESILPCVSLVDLSLDEILEAQSHARGRGVRGGGIYDFMHLIAAQKANAAALYTINFKDFQHFSRRGDPEILRPSEFLPPQKS